MNLFFSTTFPKEHPKHGQPTFFMDNVWHGFQANDMIPQHIYDEFIEIYEKQYLERSDLWHRPETNIQKNHTIRQDVNDRWKKDMIIHFRIWLATPRKSRTFLFVPLILKCTGVEKINIWYSGKDVNRVMMVSIDNNLLGHVWIHNNKVYRCDPAVKKLAQNDGFYDIQDFVDWFDDDFKGNIIHWTPFRYMAHKPFFKNILHKGINMNNRKHECLN